MLSLRLIRSLLKHLSCVLVVLTRVATSSTQKLRVLLSCFRFFVTKLHGLQGNNIESRPSCATSTGAFSGWCSQSTAPLLPSHNAQVTAPNSIQNAASQAASPPQSSTTTPPQHQTTPSPDSPVEVNILNGPSFEVEFRTLAASNSLRYDSRCCVDKRKVYLGIPPCTLEFPNKSYGPWFDGILDWKSSVHPEGALYLYNATRRTFTEGKMDETAFRLVNACIDKLHELCPSSVNLKDHNIELVLQVTEIDDSPSHKHATCQYYFVDHRKKTLFWLHHYNEATREIFCGLGGIDDPSHIAYALESEYWAHCEHYPNHELERDELLKELRGFVVYARAEIITSDASLSPFGAEDLSSILDLINHLEVNIRAGDSYSTCVIARFMHYFSQARFFNFCGLHFARLDADQAVYEEVPGSFHALTSILWVVINATLFWAPQAHHDDLRRVWVDDCIIAPRWKDFSKNLMAEWNGITIYSTVMLAVDVSFLSVPNVYILQSQSFGNISTYISTTFITGSLISSLLLARQTQKYGAESAEGGAKLLSKMTATVFGTRALATIHSLPYAMLLWGMIFFANAFLYNVFKSYTREMFASVTSGLVVVTMSIFWFIWVARDLHIFGPLVEFIRDFIRWDS